MARGFPDYFRSTYVTASNMDSQKVSCSSVEAVTTFTTPFRAFIIYNDGPHPVYIDDNTGVSTSNFKVPAKSYFGCDLAATQLYLICASGQTATVYAMVVW